MILDRHPMWVQAFGQLLNRVGVEVLGHTTDPDELVSLIETHRPDILVIELSSTNEQRGVSDVRNALEASPDLRVIVVSERADLETIEALFAEGACAYCTKAAAPDDFAAAIRQSFHRSVYLAGVRHASAVTGSAAWKSRERQNELTRRELEILTLVAEGHSNSQLARMLWVTEQTIKFHLSNIYRKLEVANRTEASRWAQLNGLLSDKPRETVTA
ncbi:MAG TPA: response regulator transcription factor [Gaiellaceae bacterium]|nr:response regulator transcription factor [Gaiellaceae bacterium]